MDRSDSFPFFPNLALHLERSLRLDGLYFYIHFQPDDY